LDNLLRVCWGRSGSTHRAGSVYVCGANVSQQCSGFAIEYLFTAQAGGGGEDRMRGPIAEPRFRRIRYKYNEYEAGTIRDSIFIQSTYHSQTPKYDQ